MTIFLLIVVIGMLIYIIIRDRGSERSQSGKKEVSYKEHLPVYLYKKCEVTLKKPLLLIDIAFSITGEIVDFDDEWIAVKKADKKQTATKIFRINNIKGIKEIQN